MIVNKVDNVITIELTNDEAETYNFIGNVLFKEYLDSFFRQRKLQEEEELKMQLYKNMTRSELKNELARMRGING